MNFLIFHSIELNKSKYKMLIDDKCTVVVVVVVKVVVVLFSLVPYHIIIKIEPFRYLIEA